MLSIDMLEQMEESRQSIVPNAMLRFAQYCSRVSSTINGPLSQIEKTVCDSINPAMQKCVSLKSIYSILATLNTIHTYSIPISSVNVGSIINYLKKIMNGDTKFIINPEQLVSILSSNSSLEEVIKAMKNYRKQKHIPTIEGFQRVVEFVRIVLNCYNKNVSHCDILSILANCQNIMFREQNKKNSIINEISKHCIWKSHQTWKLIIEDTLRMILEEHIINEETHKKNGSSNKEDVVKIQKKILFNVLEDAISYMSAFDVSLEMCHQVITECSSLYQLGREETSSLLLQLHTYHSDSLNAKSLHNRAQRIGGKITQHKNKWCLYIKYSAKYLSNVDCTQLSLVSKEIHQDYLHHILRTVPYTNIKLRSYIWSRLLSIVF